MSSSSCFPLDHLPPSEQLCYVHCNFCNTVLAVSVPCGSIMMSVTVRCGHCCNLFSVNMRSLLMGPANQAQVGHDFLSSPYPHLAESATSQNSLIPDPKNAGMINPTKGIEEASHVSAVNKPPEKRQRVPSAYNRFIKDEIQRIKAGNPDISHREAFSAAAKNWAHFPHIHFGLVPDQGITKAGAVTQEGEAVCVKDGFFSTANMEVTPF